jgi:CMP-N-acetylneuraminic acid synthetase/SAM-dependent methyltransferase
MVWTIEAAKQARLIDRIIVSTDDDEIAKVAADDTPTEPVLVHAIDELGLKSADYIVLLQATSPLRGYGVIDECIRTVKATDADSGLTVCAYDYFHGWQGNIRDDEFRPITRQRVFSQEAGKTYCENGAVYVCKPEVLYYYKNRLGGVIAATVMNGIDSLELDTLAEWFVCERLLPTRIPAPERYYKTRQLAADDFDKGYYHQTDPDGVKRDLEQEKERKQEDCKDEIAFINEHVPSEGNVLDIGCGFGFLLDGLRDDMFKFGCELSEYSGAVAHKKHEGVWIGEFIDDYMASDSLCHAIVMYHVIEHMKEPIKAIQKVWRLLKDDGYLVIGTPDFDSHCARRFGDNYRLLHDQTHISMFSTDSLKQMLIDCGFDIVDIKHPYWNTRYFTQENLERLFDTTKVSPPFVGNIVTIYARKTDNPYGAWARDYE